MKSFKIFDNQQNELELKCVNPKIVSSDNISRSLDQYVSQVGRISVEKELQYNAPGETYPGNAPGTLLAASSSGGTINVGSINGTTIEVPSDLLDGEPTFDIRSAVYFNTFNDLITYGGQFLSNGNVAITKGFYSPNDGGGSTYFIRTSLDSRINQYAQENVELKYGYYSYSSPLIDNVTLINLASEDSPLYADMQIEEGGFVNLRQVGGRPLEDGEKVNNQIYLDKALTFIKRKKYFRDIFIPAGHWCFADEDSNNDIWYLQHYVSTGLGRVGIRLYGCGPQTVCMPLKNGQNCIFHIGVKGSKPAIVASRGLQLDNLCFQCGKAGLSPEVAALYGDDKYLSKGAIFIVGCFYSSFLNLTFKYIYGTALIVTNDFESHFNYLKFHCCGGVKDGVVYPVIQLDRDGYSYASSVSANWFRVCHFDSCVGPLISGGAKNCVHNEFNAILVTGRAGEYNKVCPDASESDEAPSYSEATKWGVIDGYQGMTNFWPNLYNCVMCETFDNWAVRGSNKYRLYSVLNHTSAIHCHAQLGIVSLKLGSGSGPWVANIEASQISSSVQQLFWPEDWPYRVVKQALPRCQFRQRDDRLVYPLLMTDAIMNNAGTSETPYHIISFEISTGSQYRFLARAGRQYGFRVYASSKNSSGYWLQSVISGPSYTSGLSVVYGGGFKKVGHVIMDGSEVGSNGSWRYVFLRGCLPLSTDSNVKFSGTNIDFAYEIKKYPIGTITATLQGSQMNGKAGAQSTYTLSCSNPLVTSYSAVTANTRYISSVSISGNTLTCTALRVNTTGETIYSAVIINGKNASGSVIEKTTIFVTQSPLVMNIPDSVILDAGQTYQLTPEFDPTGSYTVSWATDKSSVATVSSGGLVTAVATGTASITASTKNSINDYLRSYCTITIPNSSNSLAYQKFTANNSSLSGVINISLTAGTLYAITVYGNVDSKRITATTTKDAGILISNRSGRTSYFIPSQNATSLNISASNTTLSQVAIVIKSSSSERVANPISSTIKGDFTCWSSGTNYYLLDTNGVLYKSTNLTTWTQQSVDNSALFTRLKKSANGSSTGYTVKSVDVKKVGSYYNLYTSSSNSSGVSWIGVSQSSSITGPFEFVGSIITSGLYARARVIDSDVYLTYGEGNLKIVKLASDGLSVEEEGTVFLGGISNLKSGCIAEYKDNFYFFVNTPSDIHVYRVSDVASLMDGSEELTHPTNPILLDTQTGKGITNPTFGNRVFSVTVNKVTSYYMLFMTDQGLCIQQVNWTEYTNEFDDKEWWPGFKNSGGASGQIMQTITKPL